MSRDMSNIVPRTRKPCPGCGETPWRAVDKVCSYCADLIRVGADAKYTAPAGDKVRIPERPYAWRRYFASVGVRGLHESPGASELSEALSRFVWAVSQPDETTASAYDTNVTGFTSDGQGGWSRARVLPAGSREHLIALDKAIQETLTEAARVAFKSGRNLLMSLNNGTISPDEFAKRDGERG